MNRGIFPVSIRWILFFLLGTLFGVVGSAKASSGQHLDRPIIDLIQHEMPGLYFGYMPGMRFEFNSKVQWTSELKPANDKTTPKMVVQALNEISPGQLQFTVVDGESSYNGVLTFEVYIESRVALKRIFPGEPLKQNAFKVREVNVTSGMNREMRGLILSTGQKLERLQARQTILEGGLLVSSAVQKVFDIKRGDPVRIQLVTKELNVSVVGTAEEPAYLNESVHVISQKTKQRLVGRLTEGSRVEVAL